MFSRRTDWQLAPNAFSRALEKHRAAGRELLDLSASNPTQIGLHYNSNAILKSLLDPRALQYHPDAQGLPVARSAVVDYYRERGASVPASHLVLTTSTSEGYSFVFRLLCEPGDEVLVASPSYPLFDFLAGLQDVKLRSYPLFYDHGWHIDLHALKAALTERTRAVLVVNPNNPTGSYVKADDIEGLNALCAERELALVADEVFLDFAHDGALHPSLVDPIMRSPDQPLALTFTLSGLSKIAGLPQMKFAWIAVSGPPELVETAMARLEVIADTYLSLNIPVQLAAPRLFDQRQDFQCQLMERIHTNLAELKRQLATQKVCSRLQIEGGWYAVLRVPATRSDEQLAIELLEEKSVLVHPGHFYDFPSDGYLVLSLITPEREFKDGLWRALEFVIANL
ncbi:MAG: pyridoxal phosphate-dependent aminotransferase [Terriglobales bacterium]